MIIDRKHVKYMSSNNYVGWLHYYIAHLMVWSGKTYDEAIEFIPQNSHYAMQYGDDGLYNLMTDNMCIMYSNGWRYEFKEYDEDLLIFQCGVTGGYFVDRDMVQEWITRLER